MVLYEPNPIYTPGVVDSRLTDKVLRGKDFTTKTYRDVPASVKKSVYQEYNMSPDATPCPCEVDHFISLELGGSNDIKNLWPQPYSGKWNAHDKDKLEDELGRLVKNGTLSGELARKEITDGWVASYIKRFGDKYK